MLTFTIHMLSKTTPTSCFSFRLRSIRFQRTATCMETTQRAAATAKYQAFSTRYTQPLPTQNHLILWHSKSVCCRHSLCLETNCVRLKKKIYRALYRCSIRLMFICVVNLNISKKHIIC